MSRKRYQAKAKKIQKLGRDGLVEQNRATGGEQRISQRTADISFDHERPQEQAARGPERTHTQGRRRKQARYVQQQDVVQTVPSGTAEIPGVSEPYTPEQDIPDIPEAVSSMRGAGDTPVFSPPPDTPPADDGQRGKRRRRKKSRKEKQRQVSKFVADAAKPEDHQPEEPNALHSASDAPIQNRPPGTQEQGGRLQFDTGNTRKQADHAEQEPSQDADDVPLPESPSDRQEQPSGRLRTEGGERLQFDTGRRQQSGKKRQRTQFSADTSKLENRTEPEPMRDTGDIPLTGQPPDQQEQPSGRLRTEGGERLQFDTGRKQQSRQKRQRTQSADTRKTENRTEPEPMRDAGDVPLTGQPPDQQEQPSGRLRTGGGERLQFDTGRRQQSKKKQQRTQFSADTGKLENRTELEPLRDADDIPLTSQPPDQQEQPSGRLHTEGGERLQFDTGHRPQPRKRQQRTQFSADTVRPEDRTKEEPLRDADDIPLTGQPPNQQEQPSGRLHTEGGERLQFDTERPATAPSDTRKPEKKRRQAQAPTGTAKQEKIERTSSESLRSTGDVPLHTPPSDRQDRPPGRLHTENRSRLRFDAHAPVSAADTRIPEKGEQTAQVPIEAIEPETAEQPVEAPVMRSGNDAPILTRPPADLPPYPGGGRLKFETGRKPPTPPAPAASDQRTAAKKRQTISFAVDAAKPQSPKSEAPPAEKSLPPRPPAKSGRLRFEAEPAPESAAPDTTTTDKQRQAVRFAAAAVLPKEGEPPNTSTGPNPPPAPEQPKGRLQFEPEQETTPAVPESRAVPEKRETSEIAVASKSERNKLRFEDDPPETDPPSDTDKLSRQQKRYNKAARRVEQAEHKLEKAQAKLPTKRRVYLERKCDADTGKVRHRLNFEEEVIPEGTKPPLPQQAVQGAVRSAKTTLVMKAHSKIRETERENVAVEAAHKGELLAEQGAGRALRWNKNRLQSKPYREVRKAERRLTAKKADLAWQTALRDNPELQQKHAAAKWLQKQKIKRKYAQAAHEAKETAQFTQNVLTSTGQIIRAVAQYVSAHRATLLIVALIAVIIVFLASGLTSCTAMLSGVQSSFLSATYLANEEDITNSDLYFTELETDLQMDIDSTETNFPGYDEYRYDIGEISHNPYELMAYLSTAYNAFTFSDVQAEIERLFHEKYVLTRTEEEDEEGRRILITTLTVRRMVDIIAASLPSSEEVDRYQVYMQTYGNRQAYSNPFDFSWLNYVSSGYGYRVHPISGEKNLHRGVDIAVAQGTPIKAIQDGRVVSAGDAGGYGLCVVIEDDNGYQSRYAHCSSLSVSAGQEVKRGDVIAAVGSTGQSTGPHLHLEVMLNGEYLNPYYFVDNGDDGSGSALPGTPGGPVIPDYSGEPMGDQTFEAMMQEAEKYLGRPYVWGGSSPSTGFDCSGFVSWVINHSGWNVGRLGVLGLQSICTPVSSENAKPGDLVLFIGTYDAPLPGPTHVGIYVGEGRFIHCGNPIAYANLSNPYWSKHFYGFCRLP